MAERIGNLKDGRWEETGEFRTPRSGELWLHATARGVVMSGAPAPNHGARTILREILERAPTEPDPRNEPEENVVYKDGYSYKT